MSLSASSTSASVVSFESEKRIVARARAAVSPMAVSTWEGSLAPDWQALPAKTPAKIRELLRQCLQKDAGSRLNNIGDARGAIEETQRGWNRWQVTAMAVAAIALIAVGAALWMRNRSAVSDRSQWVQVTKFPDSVTQPTLFPPAIYHDLTRPYAKSPEESAKTLRYGIGRDRCTYSVSSTASSRAASRRLRCAFATAGANQANG